MSNAALLFLKQLVDNAEFANESGVLRVVALCASQDPDVRDGTTYAAGALDTLRRLLLRRPDLLTPAVVHAMEAVARDSDSRVSEVIREALASSNPASGVRAASPDASSRQEFRVLGLGGMSPAQQILRQRADLVAAIARRPEYESAPTWKTPKGEVDIARSLAGVAANLFAAARALETGLGIDDRPITPPEVAAGLTHMYRDLWCNKTFRAYMERYLPCPGGSVAEFELRERGVDASRVRQLTGDLEVLRQSFATMNTVARAIEGTLSTSWFRRFLRWW